MTTPAMSALTISAEVLRQHGLTPDEYEKIKPLIVAHRVK